MAENGILRNRLGDVCSSRNGAGGPLPVVTGADIALSHLLTDLAILTPGEIELSVIANDPADHCSLECAVEGNTGDMVSGDQDLLELDSS